MTHLLNLSFAVPADIAMEFQDRAHALIDDLISTHDDTEDRRFELLSKHEARQLDQWEAPQWTVDDAASGLLEWTIRDLHPQARQVLAHLMVHADKIVTTEDLVELLELDTGKSLPPTIKALCRSSRRAGRHPLYDFVRHPQRGYRMPTKVAKMIRALEVIDANGNLLR